MAANDVPENPPEPLNAPLDQMPAADGLATPLPLNELSFRWSRAHDQITDAYERAEHHLLGGTAVREAIEAQGSAALGYAMTWLRRLADDVAATRVPLPLGADLVTAGQQTFRFILESEHDAIALVRSAEATGDPPSAIVRRAPKHAATLRDLSRCVGRLRGTRILDNEDPATIQTLSRFGESLNELSRGSVSPVPDHLRISRDDLIAWVDSATGHEFPELIRQLVAETAIGLQYIHFPAGTGAATGGWDGLTEAAGESLYVPEGVSGWELAIRKDSNAKAAEDYSKRVDGARGASARETTYVQVICRPWINATEFETTHKAEGRWKDVRALNVDDIEAWLAQSPQTTAWLAEKLHRPILGVRTSDDWWSDWLQSTEPPLDATIVLAGREDDASKLVERIQEPGVTTLGGDVRADEVRAFVAAALARTNEDDPTPAALFLSDTEDARRLLSRPGHLVAVVPGPEFLHAGPAGAGHHVIVPTPGTELADLVLPLIAPEPVREAMEAAGMLHRDASDNAALARRSLLALRRRLAKQPALHRPSWAAPGATVITRRVLLASTWNQTSPGDIEAISTLMTRPYPEVEETLRAAAAAPDSPMVAVVDERWHVVSPMDTWMLVAPQLTTADLRAFRDLAIDVLLTPDPREGMSESERLRASLDGVRVRYSSDLTKGVASSLALLGTLGGQINAGSGQAGGQIAASIVWHLMEAANTDRTSAIWQRLAPHLPLLAEAAPEVILDGLQRALSSGHPFNQDVFADKERTQFGSPLPSPHTHVLWALETLVWSQQHFDAAVTVLAMLADLDPGGEWSNRPSASLAAIFCPWHPNTSSSAEQRTATLRRLRQQRPSVAWDLLLSMLPDSHTFQTIHQGPDFRDWKSAEPVVTRSEYAQIVQEVGHSLIEDAAADTDRWVTLIKHMADFAASERQLAVQVLTELVTTSTLTGDTEAIWNELRDLISHHREYSDTVWALPEADLEPLEELACQLAPASVQNRHEWLFDDGFVELGDARRRDDFAEYDRLVAERRTEAVSEILIEDGVAGLFEFGVACAAPGEVGAAAARIDGNDLARPMAEAFESEDEKAVSIAWGYFTQTFQLHGWGWADDVLSASYLRTPAGVARFLRSTFDRAAADRAETLGPEVSDEYWRHFSYFGLGHDFPDAIPVSTRLIEVGRPAAALVLVALYSRKHPSLDYAQAAVRAFEALMELPDDPEMASISEYNIRGLLDLLAQFRNEVGVDRVVRIEWYFLPLLGFDPDAPTLHRALAENPHLFADMVTRVYRARPAADEDESEPKPATDLERQLAENSFRLLRSWHLCPGTDDDGDVTLERLEAWVSTARALLIDAGREVIGDQQIGQALAAAPGGADGLWPAEPVRQLLENLQNEQVERGLEVRILNNGGVTGRSMDEGGRKEWVLAETYNTQATQLQTHWPRIASIYRRLASSYEADARREDAEAEAWRRGLRD